MISLKRKITPLMNKQGKYFKDLKYDSQLRPLLNGFTPPDDLFEYNNVDDIDVIQSVNKK